MTHTGLQCITLHRAHLALNTVTVAALHAAHTDRLQLDRVAMPRSQRVCVRTCRCMRVCAYVCVCPPQCKLDRRSKQMVLRKATNKLLDCGVTSRQSIEYVLHARVPIIKFRDSVHGKCRTQ